LAEYVALNIDKKNTGLILLVAMEVFHDVLFEVSNEDRYKILLQLANEPMNVTQLSKRLGLSLTETSRHLSRIGEVGLTRRDADGLNHINNFGKALLVQFKGAEFVTRHRDYFTSHSMTHLPSEFVCRIGELINSTYTEDALVFLHSVATGIQEAEKFILVMIDQFVMSQVPFAREALERNVKMKTIEPKEWVAPPDFYRIREEAERTWAKRARDEKLLAHRVLKKVELYIHMSEKETAIAFPTLDGRFDHLGFTSTDKQALKWCRDIFHYYWEKSNPLIEPLRDFPHRQ
jgi:predicted transcriptional regulator